MPVSVADAAHLLRRSGFGVTTAKLNELTKLATRNAAVDRVLAVPPGPAPALPIATTPLTDQYGAWAAMSEWWLDRMRTSPTPIAEKMTLFWHGHFVTGLNKVLDMGLLAQQHQTLRRSAMRDFHALAQDVAVDPAMLLYLDNCVNFVWSAQENFARELMELFTMGVGAYSQGDVVSMARAWTGYSVDDSWRAFRNRTEWHDAGTKVLFSRSAPWDGPAALTEVLKGSQADVAARFIAAKVFSHLAYPVAPSDPVVAPIATAFRSADLDITTLVREIFRSSAFWSSTARRALVRTPVEWIVATLQATGLSAAQALPVSFLERMGQMLFNAPDVSGWKQNDHWLPTSATWGRSGWALVVRHLAWQAGLFAGVEKLSPSSIATRGFQQFGITEPAATTRAALETWAAKAKADGDAWSIPYNLTLLVMLSPDFQVG